MWLAHFPFKSFLQGFIFWEGLQLMFVRGPHWIIPTISRYDCDEWPSVVGWGCEKRLKVESLGIQSPSENGNPRQSMYGIFPYIWLICMVNVGKYTIHGSYGNGTLIYAFRFGDWTPQSSSENMTGYLGSMPSYQRSSCSRKSLCHHTTHLSCLATFPAMDGIHPLLTSC